MTTNDTTWMDAKAFKIFGHPIPGRSGINSMRAFVTIAEDAQPVGNTAYFAFNKNYGMLIILHVRADGRMGVTKEYVMNRKRSFNVAKLLRTPGRLTKHARSEFEKLVNECLEKEE